MRGMIMVAVLAAALGLAAGWWLAGNPSAGAATASATESTQASAPKYALQAWEGCRALDAGTAFDGPAQRTLTLSDGRSLQLSLVPESPRP